MVITPVAISTVATAVTVMIALVKAAVALRKRNPMDPSEIGIGIDRKR